MTETFNPRDNSPIKAPKQQVCVTCGQPIHSNVKPMNNHMNVYVNPISKREVVINNNEEKVSVQGVDLIRKDIHVKNEVKAFADKQAEEAKKAAAAAAAKVPPTPPAPVKTAPIPVTPTAPIPQAGPVSETSVQTT